MTSPHILCIMSHYTDPVLSLRRLEISRATLLPSLAAQTRKPTLHIVVSQHDPYLRQRSIEYDATGCEVFFLYRDTWRLYGEDWQIPEGHCIVGRVDDDDVLRADFCEIVYHCGMVHRERAIIWPVGLVYWRGQMFRLEHKGNQYLTLSTSRGIDPHHKAHAVIQKEWRSVRASLELGWIWVRHGDAETSTLPKYRSVPAGDWRSDKWPVDLVAVDSAIAPSGVPSADYREHGQRPRGMRVSQWLSVHGSDKVSTHNYGSFYDSLFDRLRPQALLEIGVYRGASLRAWRAAGVPVVVGVDRDVTQNRSGLPVLYAEMPHEAEAIARRLQSIDIIIDDGSHLYYDYTATADVLLQRLRPGGVYVIEDIQTQDSVDALRAAGWQIEDWRESTGRYDDVIAWRVRE
ncbi:MAG: class I SAM-dependent methyltransferase [Alphaproteobacteria bacterium]